MYKVIVRSFGTTYVKVLYFINVLVLTKTLNLLSTSLSGAGKDSKQLKKKGEKVRGLSLKQLLSLL